MRDGQFAENFDARRADANHGDHQVVAADLNPDAGPEGEPFPEVVCGHCGETVLSDQRMMWNTGLYWGGRKHTSPDPVRRGSEYRASPSRSREVERKDMDRTVPSHTRTR